ncbi:MAG TPA: hypothetical protein VEK15_02355 [Vicinamibacteria bacterium]|nr:hypothetical protein [Vicinamibacteria bacterium]
MNQRRYRLYGGTLLIFGALVHQPRGAVEAQSRSGYVRLVRELDVPAASGPERVHIDVEGLDPLNTAIDRRGDRLLALNGTRRQWLGVAMRPDGSLDTGAIQRFDASALNVETPRGLTVDPESGDVYVLDGTRPRIVHLDVPEDGSLEAAFVSEIWLGGRVGDLQGLAFDPANGHLHSFNAAERRLYEIGPTGAVLAYRDLSSLGVIETRSLAFAPSGDSTDDPSQMSLYLSGALTRKGGNTVLELSFVELPPPPPVNDLGTLVRTINTSGFSPPSPDPSGIAYLGSTGRLLMSDGEVDEMPIYQGANAFDFTLQGNLVNTFTTLPYSDEPAGLAFNPNNLHLYFSDDTSPRVYELNPGTDTLYGTADDSVTSFRTPPFGSSDPEGVAYDSVTGALFIADGVNSEVYRVAPGANGIFDGVPPTGDDQVTSFDTAIFGVTDPEGIEYDLLNDALYVVGRPPTAVAHVTTGGTLLRIIDISAANARKPAGLALGPGSVDSLATSLYIADRGVDNDTNPQENDGKVYELSFPPFSRNEAPIVWAGPNQQVTLPFNAILDAIVADDGLPGPPALTTSWSQQSGPGVVQFVDPSAADTSVRFLLAGTYVLRLTADDGELTASDDVVITVTGTGITLAAQVAVDQSSDDAEENPGGNVTLGSSDLDMGAEGDDAVGIRFQGLAVPPGAKIAGAFVQFRTDETGSEPSSLLIEGVNASNTPTFSSSTGNVSTRPRTSAEVGWSPPTWTTIGSTTVAQRTPDISPIVQEIVNRSGWSNGNALALIVTGSGTRVATSYDGDPDGAPLLRVDYLLPDLVLTNGTVNDNRYYVACNSITAGPSFTLLAPASVLLRAGNIVVLRNGFSVGSGASISIQLDPNCTLNFPPP